MADLITWTCGSCRKPIDDGTGFLQVSEVDAINHMESRAAWDEKYPNKGHSVAEILELPDKALWESFHAECDPRDEAEAQTYSIDVARVRSTRQFLVQVSDLMSKTWVQHTELGLLLRQVGSGS